MRLTLERRQQWPGCTIGRLSIDDQYECDTLEDPVRPGNVKVPGATAIPAGSYPVQITWSPRFKQMMPVLLGVPNFSGIRIHPGNTADDTEGCILVGAADGSGQLVNSRLAYLRLFDKLHEALAAGQSVLIDVVDAWEA